jgi:antitoxin component YwqK of YwqJK toxin-antitoxin module
VIDGETHGIARDWHDNGQLASETNYVQGKIQGIIRDWDTDGSLLHEREYVLPNAVHHKTLPMSAGFTTFFSGTASRSLRCVG